MFFQHVRPYIERITKQNFKRGEIIYHEGSTPENIYFIESGIVGLFHVSPEGKESFFRVFGRNDILGHRSYFAQEPYHASSIALSPVELVIVSKNECDRIFMNKPDLVEEIAKMMAKDLGNAELRMAGLLDKTAHKRISESLVFLKLKHPDHVWTRKEIGEYSGSTFETVARVMTILERKGLIQKQGRDFQILDVDKLLSLQENELH